MAVSKVILNGVTLIDTTDKTVSVDKLLDGYTALKNDGTSITGSYVAPTPSGGLAILFSQGQIPSGVSPNNFVISSDSSGNNVINSAETGDTIYFVNKKTSGTTYIEIWDGYTWLLVDRLMFTSAGNQSFTMPNYPLYVTYSWER